MEERGRLDPEVIDQVRAASDIVAVVGEYVHLKRSGRSYVGLCPFHQERTPSFTVSPEKQLYYCFGCGAGGNVFQFIMRVEGLDFGEAVRLLAERAGMRLKPATLSPAQKAEEARRERFLAMLDWTARYYHWLLTEKAVGEKARAYLKQRGVSQEMIVAFGLGYAPEAWDELAKHLARRDFDLAEAEMVGLVMRRQDGGGYYDRFRDRLIFPIRNYLGRVIGFGGRTLGEGEPKYLNSPETVLFSKGKSLYGLDLAREAIRSTGQAILVEGYLDAIVAHQFGFKNTVASLGTALTPDQIRLISRYGRTVILAYDADTAGEAATWRGLELALTAGLEVRVLTLPAGDDPDVFLLREGPVAFRERMEQGLPLVEYMLSTVLSRHNLALPQERSRAVQEIYPILARIEAPTEREFYLTWTADRLGVRVEALRREMRLIALKSAKRSRERNTSSGARYNRNNPVAPSALEKEMLRWFLLEPARFAEARSEGELVGFVHPLAQALVEEMGRMGWGEREVSPSLFLDKLEREELRSLAAALIMVEENFTPEKKKELSLAWRKYCWRLRLGNLWRRLAVAEQNQDLEALNQVVLEYKSLRKVYHT